MEEKLIKQIFGAGFIAILLIFSYMMIRPIFFAIIMGLILAYVFNPMNKKLLNIIKNETASALIICILVLIVLVVSLWAVTPILARQIFNAYVLIKSFDIVGFMEKFFPVFVNTDEKLANFMLMYNNFLSTAIKSTADKATNFIVDFPSFLLKLFVVFIVFFYSLKDGDKILNVMRHSLPFKPETTDRFINKSKIVTFSVLFGRIIIGILTGLLAGIGFYFAGVGNSILLTVLAIIASIIPVIGPWLIWVPVVFMLFLKDSIITATLLLIYCSVVVTLFEHLAHTLYISRKAQVPTFLTLIGLIGGLMVFGMFGIILGPLIIAYLAVVFDLYLESNKKTN